MLKLPGLPLTRIVFTSEATVVGAGYAVWIAAVFSCVLMRVVVAVMIASRSCSKLALARSRSSSRSMANRLAVRETLLVVLLS